MHQLINSKMETLESDIYKLSQQLHEYIYLNDYYDSEIIHTMANELYVNINKLLEFIDQNNKE